LAREKDREAWYSVSRQHGEWGETLDCKTETQAHLKHANKGVGRI
jgi:hypothetical protein